MYELKAKTQRLYDSCSTHPWSPPCTLPLVTSTPLACLPEQRTTTGLVVCCREPWGFQESLLERGGVDLVTGPDAYRDLPRLLGLVGAAGGGESAGAVNVQVGGSLWPTRLDLVSFW